MSFCQGVHNHTPRQASARYSPEIEQHLSLKMVEINSSFFRHRCQASAVQSLDRLGRKLESDPAIALRPPNSLRLEVSFLQPLGAAVGVRNGKGIISLFPS